jgi:NAD(P)H dehydrogenase (quinone)
MKILILNAHPYPQSFCESLANAYREGAESTGNEIKFTNLRDLDFSLILKGGYSEETILEPDLQKQQEFILWCEHLVIITPVWWMSSPALLKGYIDRIFLPGFAHKQKENSPFFDKLLKGRSASVIYTQGSPKFVSLFFLGDCFWKAIKLGVLDFCGFKPIKRFYFGNVNNSSSAQREKWINTVKNLGIKGF